MNQSARFWDRIAERYSKRPVADEAAYQKKLQVTRGYLHPGMEVLCLLAVIPEWNNTLALPRRMALAKKK